MIDISQTVAPKRDQLNADDLIVGPRTIRVTRVSKMSEPDLPIAIYFEGGGGKPYKPGKSMRRVLLWIWGADGSAYAGRRMTLFRDDGVQFGSVAVGGIRISHMSGITSAVTMALTATKARRVPYTVKPLGEERSAAQSQPSDDANNPQPEPRQQSSNRDRLFAAAREAAGKGHAALSAFRDGLDPRADEALAPILSELDRAASYADAADNFPGSPSITDEKAVR